MESKPNFAKTFITFKRHYKLVPLEVFKKNAYKTLISTILSARTNDDVTLLASKRLFKIAPDLKSLKQINQSIIQQLIFPVGFYRTKAKHLYRLSRLITKVPNTSAGLMALPGVGRKTANLVLNRAFGVPAISVDTHVHRISNLLGWVKTKRPEQTEKELVKILPRKYWPDINRFFVSIGRQFPSKKKLEEFLKIRHLL